MYHFHSKLMALYFHKHLIIKKLRVTVMAKVKETPTRADVSRLILSLNYLHIHTQSQTQIKTISYHLMLLKTIISGNTAWAEKPAYTRN